jgi:hypothetical protein
MLLRRHHNLFPKWVVVGDNLTLGNPSPVFSSSSHRLKVWSSSQQWLHKASPSRKMMHEDPNAPEFGRASHPCRIPSVSDERETVRHHRTHHIPWIRDLGKDNGSTPKPAMPLVFNKQPVCLKPTLMRPSPLHFNKSFLTKHDQAQPSSLTP